MRLIAELAGAIVLLLIFLLGLLSIVHEMEKSKRQEKKDGEDDGHGEGRGTSH